MDLDLKDIGARIKHYRAKSNLSQEQLAEKTNTSRVFISLLEKGSRLPSLETIVAIANAMAISADDLLSGNLMVDDSKLDSDEVGVLSDCSIEERRIILAAMNSLKAILHGYRITK